MVKFGKYLKENAITEWQEYYTNYKALKTLVYAIEMQLVPSDKDVNFFRARVMEDALNVERWFKKVRDDTMGRLYFIKGNLPEAVQLQLHTTRCKKSSTNSFDEKALELSRRSVARQRHFSDEQFSSSGNELSSDEHRHAAATTTRMTSDATGAASIRSATQPIAVLRAGASMLKNATETESLPTEGLVLADPRHDEEEEEEEGVNGGGVDADDYLGSEASDEAKYNEAAAMGPVEMYLGDSLYSHLPTSAHQQVLGLLQIMARLKLFGWQNGEGLRKVIKKFDKRCGSTLTLSFWPQMQRFDFCNERRIDACISECAAVLTTRVIPFSVFNVRLLKVKGVDLTAMSRCIQQLETVCDEQLPEVVPMSVEPRSYMANERTFLKWMRMGALTAFIAVVLMAFKHEAVTGVLLLLFSLFIVMRSFHEYRRRTESLVERVDHNWDDHFGAKLMVMSLVLPMLTYLVYLAVFGLEDTFNHSMSNRVGGILGVIGIL